MRNKFSVVEFYRGTAATIVLIPLLGIAGLFLSAATGLLWMLGGTYSKAIRRYGVPLTALIYMGAIHGWRFSHERFIMLGVAGGIAILHLGDGFPDHRPTTESKGSRIGRFVERYIDSRDSVGGPITKFLIVLFFQVSLIPYFLR